MNKRIALLLAVLLTACATERQETTAPAGGTAKPQESRAADQTAARREARPLAPMAESVQPKLAAPASMGALMPMPSIAPPMQDRERYQATADNPVHQAAANPVSTFSIDVDTGSYSNVRRMLNEGRLPPADAVRVEEMVNYFPYDYARPTGRDPFAVHTELAPAPWNTGNVLLRVGIKGQDLAKASLPPANLVFLVDVSGSMSDKDKLPLLKSSLKLLINELRPTDKVTLVTYSGRTAVLLPPTAASEKATLLTAIDGLQAGGSTAGASGIQLAYQMAQQSFIKNGINRILLATDGDFNVGVTNFSQLKQMVEEKRKSGVSLSTLGFGTGNYNEHLMEQLADAGDGAYSYVDSLMEGHKVLVNEMTSTLATIAQDVKIQVEFNPASVKEYRLIGYENRLLKQEDFNNDKVDAGDIGSGHTVTALYEVTLADGKGLVDPLRYQPAIGARAAAKELAFIKLRYKHPGEKTSQLISFPVERAAIRPMAQTGSEFRFAAAVAGFGQLLRGGKYTGKWSFDEARQLAAPSIGADKFGYRGEFLRLIDLAKAQSTPATAK
ncbi:MAG: VWA domain-containing protein [Rhodocyclaceae bacterium]